jgi:uncharacterized membrane protein YfcA
MIDIPDLSSIAAVVSDRRFVSALAAAVLSGVARGFAGFGSALIYIPLISAIYGPRTAAPTLVLLDLVCSLPFALGLVRVCNWREVAPMTIFATLAVPFGVMSLILVDPAILRWLIALSVLTLLAALVTGWRYHGRPNLAVTIGVALLSGLGAGAAQLSGPPVIIYWLGGQNTAAVVRANLLVFFMLISVVVVAVYLKQGLFTAETIALFGLLGAPFIVAMAAGAWGFRGASDGAYRRVAYVIMAAAALLSMPLFDRWLR